MTARPLLIAALLATVTATPAAAQTLADRESVNEVVELLLASAGALGDEIPHSPGTWNIAIARFAKGDSREVVLRASAGERYTVMGATPGFGTDIDICVYGPAGDPIDCDKLDDSVPVVGFRAEMDGTYRAVLTAASVGGGGTAFAGMIVVRDIDEGEAGDPLGER